MRRAFEEHHLIKRLSVVVAVLFLGMRVLAGRAEGVRFVTFGVGFKAPEHAAFDLMDSPSDVALYRFDKESGCEGAALYIEWAPANGKSARELAEEMVKTHGAMIEPGNYKVGGEEAVKMSADYRYLSFTRRITYLVVHGEWMYMVNALNTGTGDGTQALERILPTVVFFQPESPVKHLGELADQPLTMFGSFQMRVPACLRKFDWTSDEVNVGLHDLSGARLMQPFSVDIRPARIPQQVTFAAINEEYSAGMAKQLALGEGKGLMWHKQKGLDALNVSDAVAGTVKAQNGTVRHPLFQVCILELGKGNFVQFLFMYDSEPAADAAAYGHAVDRMLETVKLVTK